MDVYRKIESLNLDTGTLNCLRSCEIEFIEDLIKMSKEDLLKIRNLGKKKLENILKALNEKGMKLIKEKT